MLMPQAILHRPGAAALLFHAQSPAETRHRAMRVLKVTRHALPVISENRSTASASKAFIRQQPGNGLCRDTPAIGAMNGPLICVVEHDRTRCPLTGRPNLHGIPPSAKLRFPRYS